MDKWPSNLTNLFGNFIMKIVYKRLSSLKKGQILLHSIGIGKLWSKNG